MKKKQPSAQSEIRSLRKAVGLKLGDLAAISGIPATRLRALERGLIPISDRDAEQLAPGLGISSERLIRRINSNGTPIPGEGYTTSSAGSGQVTLRRNAPPGGRRRLLDLFCGAGGLSYGFEQTGSFITTGGIDLLPDRIATFTANHEFATGIAGDIRAFTPAKIREIVGEIDIVVGGPPCQGFSSIRPFRNLTESDPRNSLVEHYVLIIAGLRPAWFVFENVVGLLTHEAGVRLDAVVGGFRDAGYRVDWRILNAALYGIPQHRERIVIVGSRDDRAFRWPEPTHRAEHRSMAGARAEVVRANGLFSMHLPPALTIMDAIGDLPPVESGEEATNYASAPSVPYQVLMRLGSRRLTLHKATRHSPHMLEIIRHSGANKSALPPGMVRSGFSSCYSRLDADRPSTTLTVNFVHPASNRCIHPTQDRALTPREGARIQSFPDRFVFRGTTAQIVKQIGNAVAPLLGQQIAQAILASEDDPSTRG